MGGNLEGNTVKWTFGQKMGKGWIAKSYTGRLLPSKNFELGPLFPSFPPFTSRLRDICFLFFNQLLFDSLVIVSFFLN